MDYVKKIAVTAAAAAISVFGMTGVVTALHSAASATRHAHAPAVACSATEDSYLTDCHGHRLDYAGGQWAPRATIRTTARLLPTAAQLRKPLPRWFHAMPAPRYVALDACGRWPQYGLGNDKRGQVVPGVEVWAPHTDGAVYCASGHVSTP